MDETTVDIDSLRKRIERLESAIGNGEFVKTPDPDGVHVDSVDALRTRIQNMEKAVLHLASSVSMVLDVQKSYLQDEEKGSTLRLTSDEDDFTSAWT